MPQDSYPFQLKPLPYPYDALEPDIDEETVMLHHDKHLKTYVDNLNKALSNYPKYHDWPLTQLIKNVTMLPKEIQTTVKNNAGGVYNHNLYFDIMTEPRDDRMPEGRLGTAIDKTFGSFEQFKKSFKEAALSQFGSGWAWLVMGPYGVLKIVTTPNQDTPLNSGVCPIMLIDVWEHAYYLKYQNRRAEYIDHWFRVVNWNKVERIYEACKNRIW